MPTPLRLLRRNAGLSQDALAMRAHVAPNTVLRIERDRGYRPHPATCKRLADALGVQVLDVTEFANGGHGSGGEGAGQD
jgi:transcriptional regulator with XRE-family HTH domain